MNLLINKIEDFEGEGMKKIKIRFKSITLWERTGFFGNIKTHRDFTDFLYLERSLLKILIVLERKKRLPKNIKQICLFMKQSHINNSLAFKLRNKISTVVDLDCLISQLV